MLTLASLVGSLEEKNTWLFERIWDTFTPAELEAVLDEALKILAAGGEKTADGSRSRTSGGVFLRLLREQHGERVQRVLAEQNQRRRKQQSAALRAALESMDSEVCCPPDLLGQLIGKNGQSINALREKHPGCKITVHAATGRVHVDGSLGAEDEAVQNARDFLMHHVAGLILRTHQEYSEQVLMSDFMVSGHRGDLQDQWATMLYAWVATAIEKTTAKQLITTLIRLAAAAPPQVRQEIREQLTEQPRLLGPHEKVANTILAAIAAHDEPAKSVAEGSTACTDTCGWEELEVASA